MLNYFDVIKAQSGVPVDDIWAQLWGTAMSDKYVVTEYTGTLPITIDANGDPLIDYRIYGNTVQTGTPTPENPIMPIGCGERTENLFDGEIESGYYDNDGEKQSNPNWLRCKNLISADSNTTYHVIIDAPEGTNGSVVFVRCYDARGEYIGTTSQTVILYYKEYAFTTLNDTKFISFYISVAYIDAKIAFYQTTISGKSYTPYGYKLPMLSNSTVTNIYLGEVETTRRIKKLVLTGEENLNITDSTAESGTKVFSLRFDNIGMTDILDYDRAMSSIPYPFFTRRISNKKATEVSTLILKTEKSGLTLSRRKHLTDTLSLAQVHIRQ